MKIRFLGATPTAFSKEAWAFDSQKNPRLVATAIANALTVASSIFIGGRAPIGAWTILMETRR